MQLTLTPLLSITRYIINTATIRIIRMKPVQMIDSKLHDTHHILLKFVDVLLLNMLISELNNTTVCCKVGRIFYHLLQNYYTKCLPSELIKTSSFRLSLFTRLAFILINSQATPTSFLVHQYVRLHKLITSLGFHQETKLNINV